MGSRNNQRAPVGSETRCARRTDDELSQVGGQGHCHAGQGHRQDKGVEAEVQGGGQGSGAGGVGCCGVRCGGGWRKAGHWARILQAVSEACKGGIQMVDGSSIQVHQHGANGPKKGADLIACVARAAA